jgi:outer membrane translocation and assembly module TamA
MRALPILAFAAFLLPLCSGQELRPRRTANPKPEVTVRESDPSDVCDLQPLTQDRYVPTVHVVDVRFERTILSPRTQQAIAAELKRKEYQGDGWWQDVCDRARDQWMIRGYFKNAVHVSVDRLGGDDREQHVKVILSGRDEGNRYTFGSIAFRNAHALRTAELRRLFTIRQGEIFNVKRIRQGLMRMTRAYAMRGYINFVSVPETRIDEQRRKVDLEVDVDEGPQFRVESVTVKGAPPELEAEIREYWKSRIGKPYRADEGLRFYRRYAARLPALNGENIDDRTEIQRNEVEGKVRLVFSFRLSKEVFTCGP